MLLPPLILHHGKKTLTVKVDTSKTPAATAFLGGKPVWRYIRADWRPWKIVATDVDHDGAPDFIIALHKQTRHMPSRIHTLFVFGFDGSEVYPKWRGSSMGRDFTDFVPLLTKYGDKIVTLDRLLDGRYGVACHNWSGFGFRKEWEQGAWKRAKLLPSKRGFIRVSTEYGVLEFAADGTKQN